MPKSSARQGFLDVVVADDHFKIRECLRADRHQGLLEHLRPIIGRNADRKERC